MLYIIRVQNFLLDYVLAGADNLPHVRQIVWDRGRGAKGAEGRKNGLRTKIRRALHYIFARTPTLGCGYIPDHIIEQLQAIGPQDTALFFSFENLRNITLFSRVIDPQTARKLWLWDSLCTLKTNTQKYRQKYIKTLMGLGYRIYTFDPLDAQEHGLTLLHQLYRKPGVEEGGEKGGADLFFVGHDKPGRMEIIANVAQKFEKLGKTTKICVVPMMKKGRDPNHEKYYNQNLHVCGNGLEGYRKSIQAIRNCKVVLDVVQSGQTGMTLRAIEAMFLGKKIITTNPLIRQEPFYHPSRVWVWKQENSSEGGGTNSGENNDTNSSENELEKWLNTEFKPIDHATLSGYEVHNWLQNF